MNHKNKDISRLSKIQFIKWNWSMIIHDPNSIVILLSNLLILFFYINNSWNGLTLLLALVLQAIISMFFFKISVLFSNNYPKKGLSLSSRPNKPYSKRELTIRGFIGVVIFIFIFTFFLFPIIFFSYDLFNLVPDYVELIWVAGVFVLGELIKTIINRNKSLITHYTNLGLETVFSIILSLYGIIFIWIILIPYLGIILFILFKIFMEFLFYNLKNSSFYKENLKIELGNQ